MSIVTSLGVALGTSGVLFSVGEVYFSRRVRRLKIEREGENFSTFQQVFPEESFAREKLYHVYRFFQRWVDDDHFPVRPTDSIAELYGIVDEDVNHMVAKLSELCGSEVPQSIRGEDLRTVRDIAYLIARRR